jgi:transcriptional regulator with XRE-family HTH domain
VTGVPTTGSPTVRRRELGTILRALRTERGWTAEQVAERLLVSPSKISRLEKGQRGVSQRDIRDLCDLYEIDDEQRQRLVDLASEGKQRAGLGRDLPYSAYVQMEAEAASISDYGLGAIPGLLQTADYARAMVQAAVPRLVPRIVAQRVEGRLARQQLLFSDPGPRFEAIMDESVLHRVVGSHAVMRSQLEQLLKLSERPRVTLRVIPYEAGALPWENNKFIILRFTLPTVPDMVFVEGLTRDYYIEEPGEVERYNTTFRMAGDLAASPEGTREAIASTIGAHRG